MTARDLALILTLSLPAAAARGDDDAKAARAVVDRAIRAAGGAKPLAKPSLRGKSKGTITLAGKSSAVANEWTVQGTDQLKWSTDLTLNDQAATFVIVLNGARGWISGNNNPANPLPKESLAAFREGVRALRLAEALVPLTGKDYALTTLGELKIDGRPAVGIKAKKKGAADVDLWFDKATNLPVKAEMRLTEQGENEATWTAYFGGYKKIGGRQHFTTLKVQRDAKTVLEMERSDIKAGDKLDDETFAKP